MRDRGQPGLGDLHIVLRGVEARPDRTNHLTIDNDRKPALHFREALCRNRSEATVIDCILKRLARFLEQRGRPGLAGRSSTLAV
jgi:hypothetical protein